MTSIVIPAFSGEIPRMGDQQLPPTFATKASNCLLLSGELRSLHEPTYWATVNSSEGKIQRAYRIETEQGKSIWVPFDTKYAYFLKGPLINDIFDRYYWTTNTDVPRYNTADRIENGDSSYTLGVPRPTTAPTVTPDASGTGPVVVRAYVYTFVSTYGEEGPASDPTVVEGNDDDVWALTDLDNLNPDPTNKNLTHKRIYRTVTGTGGAASYFFVAEIPFADTSYNDNNATVDISLNNQLESLNWYPPPSNLQGIVAHPNGFLVGFVGNDLYFSEPYRPHAWPPEYVLSTSEPIVALGIFGQSVAVTTTGFPFVATGVTPASITFTKAKTPEPCLSPFGVVSMPFGVYFPSSDGLMLISANGIDNATKNLMTRDEWIRVRPGTIVAAKYNTQYVAFNSPDSGFIISPDEPNASYVSLDKYWEVDFIDSDILTGEIYLLNNYDCTFTEGSEPPCQDTEQIENGNFAVDAFWTKSASTTIASGQACLIEDGGKGYVYQDAVFEADSDYELSIDVLSAFNYGGGSYVKLYYGGDENTGTYIGDASILGTNNFLFTTGPNVGDGRLHVVSSYFESVGDCTAGIVHTLVNPGAEGTSAMEGWTTTVGTTDLQRYASDGGSSPNSAIPGSGNWYWYGGNPPGSGAYLSEWENDSVDLIADGVPAEAIDSGSVSNNLSYWCDTLNSQTDRIRFGLRYYTELDVFLETQFGIWRENLSWTRFTESFTPPATARKAAVVVYAERKEFEENSVYWDMIELETTDAGCVINLLLLNNGAEDSMNNWTTSGDFAIRATQAGPVSYSGSNHFGGGGGSSGNHGYAASGAIDLIAAGLTAVELDSGIPAAELSYFQASGFAEDSGMCGLRFLDASSVQIGSDLYDANIVISPAEYWDNRIYRQTIPAGTRYIQVLQQMQLNVGTWCQCYFDEINITVYKNG